MWRLCFLAFAAFSHNANMLTPFFFIYITRIKNSIKRIRKGNLEYYTDK